MFGNQSIRKAERGQNALETAIILIAFIVVAAIFAFTILSAASSSAEKGQQPIQRGLEAVQSTINIKGSVVAAGANSHVDSAIFTLALVAGGTPINLSTTTKDMVIGYKDANQFANDVPWKINWIVSKQAAPNDLLEEGELVEITVDLTDLPTRLAANTAFNLEIKPSQGAVLNINRTTPDAIQAEMDLK